MGGMRPPHLPEQPVVVVGPEHLVRLLKACEGRDFTSRRDTAVILLLVNTGMRRAECAGMTLDDVDLDQRIVWVLGKGRRPRALPIGRKTAQALDRYLRVRDEHWLSHLPHLWVGQRAHDPSGVYQVVHDRARAAGLPAIHPHQLRHAFAHQLAGRGWQRERANASCRLEVANDDRSLHEGDSCGARHGQPCPLVTGRPAIDPASTGGLCGGRPRPEVPARAHPYQVSRAQRCADRRLPGRWRPSGAKGCVPS